MVPVTVFLVIVLAVGHIVVAIAARPDGRDERDQLIATRAQSNTSWILAGTVFVAAFALALPLGRAWIANGLLMSLFVSEIANYIFRLYYYRRASDVGRSTPRISNQIRALRFRHGEMTQKELAERIGVTRQTVNAIEGAKYSPSLEVAFRSAEVFEVPLEEVFQYNSTSG
jgi:putative transcriptional regulator